MERWAPAPCTPTPHAAAPALLSSAQFRKVCFFYCMRHQTEEGRNYTTFLPNRRNPLGGQQLRSPLGVGRVGMSRSQGQKATMCIQRALRSHSPPLSFNFLFILQSLLELQTEAPGPVSKAFCRLGRTRASQSQDPSLPCKGTYILCLNGRPSAAVTKTSLLCRLPHSKGVQQMPFRLLANWDLLPEPLGNR